MSPQGNPTPHNYPPNPVPNIPDEPDSDPSFSDSSSSDSSDSQDNDYSKQRRFTKNNKIKHQSKTRFHDPIKNYANLIANLLKAAYKPKFIKLKLDKDPLQ